MKTNTRLLCTVFFTLCAGLAFGDSDNFDGATLNTNMWSYDITGADMSVAQTSGHVEATAPSGLDTGSGIDNNESAGIRLTGTGSAADWFQLSIDFNAADCTSQSVMNLTLENAGQNGDFFVFGNGSYNDFGAGRNWFFLKFAGGSIVESNFLSTGTDAGTFYVMYTNSQFYFSYDGVTPFATSDTSGWTSPTDFSFSAQATVWTGNSQLTGSGSYYDNFQVVPEPTSTLLLGTGSICLIGYRRRKTLRDQLLRMQIRFISLRSASAAICEEDEAGFPDIPAQIREISAAIWKEMRAALLYCEDTLTTRLVPHALISSDCPHCGSHRTRRSRREPSSWMRWLKIRHYVCNDCNRRYRGLLR